MRTRTFLALGCGTVLSLMAGAGALLWLNWDRVQGTVRESVGTLRGLTALQRSLAEEYSTSKVLVQKVFLPGFDSAILHVEITDSPKLEDLAGDRLREVALGVAARARYELDSDDYDGFRIVLARELSAGVVASSASQEFFFGAGQVPLLDEDRKVVVPEVGAFYSVDNGDGGFRIFEISERDGQGFVGRLYGNIYPTRPKEVLPSSLTMSPAEGRAGPGIDDLEVSPVMWQVWRPRRVALSHE